MAMPVSLTKITQNMLTRYEKWARGREDGHEIDDWLRSEEEITSKKVRTAAA